MAKQKVTTEQLVLNALLGECTECGWKAGCQCTLCIDAGDDLLRLLHRCEACHMATSSQHGAFNTKRYFGTFDGRHFKEGPTYPWGMRLPK